MFTKLELYFAEDACCWKSILSSWTTLYLRSCINLPKLTYTNNADSAKTYYDDTLTCFHCYIDELKAKACKPESNVRKSLDSKERLEPLLSLLVEFCEVSLLDLEIKQEAFRSREIFILMQSLIKAQITEQVKFNIESGDSSGGTEEEMLDAQMRQLMLDRCIIVHGALRVISNLLFSSECVKNRLGIISSVK